MKEEKNIDRVFKNALFDYDVEPPKYIWDDIKTGLNADRKKRQRNPE